MSAAPARVLIVDDAKAGRDILTRRLEQDGHRADSAGDGEQALDMLRTTDYDLVLLDIMMPVLDGWFVLAELGGRPRRPAVVVCSAKSGDSDRARANELGADEYVTKPFEPDDLVVVIRNVLARTGAHVA